MDVTGPLPGANPLVRLVVDTPEGVTVAELTSISRRLQADEELARLLGANQVRVEVSSPGVNSGLKEPWQYGRHIGRDLTVALIGPESEPSSIGGEVEGRLVHAGREGIVLDTQAGEASIAWGTIAQAHVQLNWQGKG